MASLLRGESVWVYVIGEECESRQRSDRMNYSRYSLNHGRITGHHLHLRRASGRLTRACALRGKYWV
jgi:hypothetical protein